MCQDIMQTTKLYYLQIVRAIAFWGVFLSHTGVKFFGAAGAWGVSVFFILSGFLMIYNYYGKNKIEKCRIKDNLVFSWKKIKKMYFLHIVMMFAEIILLTILDDNTISIKNIFLNVFLLQAWVPIDRVYFSLNQVAWYLSVCCFIYFVFPYFLKIIEKYRRCRSALIVMLITYMLQIGVCYFVSIIPVQEGLRDSFVHWGTYISPLTRTADFFIGCNLGYLFLNRTKDSQKSGRLFEIKTGLLLVVIILQWWIYNRCNVMFSKVKPHPEIWWMNTIFFTITSCCFIYLFAQRRNTNLNMLEKKLIYIGNISTYGFLIHLVVIRYIRIGTKQLLGYKIQGTWGLVISAFLATIVICEVWRRIDVRKSKQWR